MPSAEHDAVVELLRAAGSPTALSQQPIEEQRVHMDAATSVLPVPDEVTITEVEAGDVPAEWHVPPGWSGGGPHVLYLHGGAYNNGSVASHRSLGARLAVATKSRVLVLGYRLAPEHPYPAAMDDATTAYRWLLDQGADPDSTAVAGDSAGGGLSLALLLTLRDAGHPMPGAAVLLSPWTDLTLSGPSMKVNRDADPMVIAETLHPKVKAYLAGADPTTPTASPLYADLAGLPPLLVIVGTREVLLDDSTRLADRARNAGVKVELDVHEDLVHVFPLFAGVPEAEEALARMAAWLGPHLAPAQEPG